MIGTLLPWVKRTFVDPSGHATEVKFGAESILGVFALLASVLLFALTARYLEDGVTGDRRADLFVDTVTAAVEE